MATVIKNNEPSWNLTPSKDDLLRIRQMLNADVILDGAGFYK